MVTGAGQPRRMETTMAANQIPRRKAHRPQLSPDDVLALVVRKMGVPEVRILDYSDRMPAPVEARHVLAGLLYDCGGLSTCRIAAKLGTSRSVVSKWLHRWRAKRRDAHRRWFSDAQAESQREVAA